MPPSGDKVREEQSLSSPRHDRHSNECRQRLGCRDHERPALRTRPGGGTLDRRKPCSGRAVARRQADWSHGNSRRRVTRPGTD